MGKGIAICLHPVGHTQTHSELNGAIEVLGKDGGGLANINDVKAECYNALLNDKTEPPSEDCKRQAIAEIEAQTETEDLALDDQLVRTTFKKLPSNAAKKAMNLVKG